MKKALIFIVLVAVFAGAFFGIQKYNQNKANELLVDAELEKGLLATAVKIDGLEYLVDPNDLYETGIDTKESSSLDNPKFTNVATADEYLADEVHGVDVEVDGQHRFYSYQILNWHQVVNDNFNGKDLAVTYCVFCRSYSVYETAKEFDLDGRVYNNNDLLTERGTSTVWSQMRGVSVIGKTVGESLTRYTADSMAWEDWKELYPEGEVLSTDTGFVRDYTRHPYLSYDTARTIYFPVNDTDAAQGIKELVHGVDLGNVQIAFSEYIMRNIPVEAVDFNEHEIVGFLDEVGVMRIYENRVDDSSLEFDVDIEVLEYIYDTEEDTIFDAQTGSEWNRKGEVIEGPLLGQSLKRLESVETFWFVYAAMYPDALVADLNAFPGAISEAEAIDNESEVLNVN